MEELLDEKNGNADLQPLRIPMVPEDTRGPQELSQSEVQKSVLEQTKNKKTKGKITCICKKCEREFYIWKCHIKNGYGYYCSNECARNGTITKNCIRCGKPFETYKSRKDKYCSHKCSRKPLIKRTCNQCKKDFYIEQHKIKQGRGIYCSRKCANTMESNPNYKGGLSFEPYCPKWTRELRERIRVFFEYQCIICGKHETKLKRKLCCHHVEYNKQACCDGKPVHFATMCMKHHTSTNNDRDLWESRIHRIIYEIYDNKSYYTREEWYNIGINKVE